MARSTVFFFNDTATTEIYTLSLHDALPIFCRLEQRASPACSRSSSNHWDPIKERQKPETSPSLSTGASAARPTTADRKSTRLNSSHANISYAVFCLKKKKTHPSRPSPHTLP